MYGLFNICAFTIVSIIFFSNRRQHIRLQHARTGGNISCWYTRTGAKIWHRRSDKTALTIRQAVQVGRGRRWCYWNHFEKTHPKTPCTPWLEAPEAAKTTSNQNGDISGRRSRTRLPKSDTPAISVIWTAMKRRVHRHPTHPNHRRCCHRQSLKIRDKDDTSDKLSPVSLTPVNNLSLVSWHRW